MVTAKTLAFYAEIIEVRIFNEGLVPIYMDKLDDWLNLTVKVHKP